MRGTAATWRSGRRSKIDEVQATSLPWLRSTVAVGAWIVLTAPSVRAATEFSVAAVARDTAVEVTARAVVRATPQLIWQTLTDYDHLAQFVPGISSSHTVSRQGSESVVEQIGRARLWFFSYPIRVTLHSNERPYQRIEVHLVSGNLRRLDGGYRIEPRADGSCELIWNGMIEPEEPLPGFIRIALLRGNISDQFAGMVREIERRAGAPESNSDSSKP
jgi:ribosome-associated toxin RatA of RatAB toxin-antitoxin module